MTTGQPHYFRVTTICGSMRFYDLMLEAAKDLSRREYVVIMPHVVFSPEQQLTDADKKMLDQMHFFKIDMSQSIHVVTMDGYIGESTRNEIEYASRTGKAVRYWTMNNASQPMAH